MSIETDTFARSDVRSVPSPFALLATLPVMAFGVASAVWPYRVARFEERVDAIGSRRSWDEVEPTNSKVGLTRVVGVLLVLVGYGWLVVLSG